MDKTPRFFCDNCGYEVGNEVKTCPFCGRYFASVRCPVCDYSGPDKAFKNGCPLCGYSASAADTRPIKQKRPRPKKQSSGEPLPPWAYIIAVIVLFAVVLLFSFIVTR
jgi:uncharacterized membrane protein YvbJ